MKIEEIINYYNSVVRVIDKEARELDEDNERAYGGVVRVVKGKLQEFITEEIIKLAWEELNGNKNRIEINSNKIKIPILSEYIEKIKIKQVRDYILLNKKDYYYGLSVDKHIFIDGKFVSGIECKAFTENAMIKRILVDFHLLKTQFPNISCYLFQLESQLTGDYSQLNPITYGSKSTHSIMSYFPDVELNIFTFLKGERDINKPIHKYFKSLEYNSVKNALNLLKQDLRQYL